MWEFEKLIDMTTIKPMTMTMLIKMPLKVMENDDMNMMSGEVNASTLLDFFNQLTSKSSSSLESLPIKVAEWQS